MGKPRPTKRSTPAKKSTRSRRSATTAKTPRPARPRAGRKAAESFKYCSVPIVAGTLHPYLNPTERKLYYYDEAEADRVVAWFAAFIRHSKPTANVDAGEPFILLPWQERLVRAVFGIKKKADNLRRFSKVYVEIPKKNGKSFFGSALAAYLLFGDRENSAEVYSLAADSKQARIIFRQCAEMIRSSPVLKKRSKILKTEILLPQFESFYRPLSKAVEANDGVNAHGTFFDELHRQKTRDQWDCIEHATAARRQPLMFVFTTAGQNLPNSIYIEVNQHARKVIDDPSIDCSWFSMIFAPRSKKDRREWRSERVWLKVNPGIGHTITLERLREAYNFAKGSPSAEANFRRLRLNMIETELKRAIDLPTWIQTGKANPVDDKLLVGRECYGGLDLSIADDLTALVLCFPPSDQVESYLFLSRFFLPEENLEEKAKKDRFPYVQMKEAGYLTTTPGEVIDYEFLTEDVKRLQDSFDIKEVGFDPWNARDLANKWEAELGIDMVQTRQGAKTFNEPTLTLFRLIKQRRIGHGENPILTWNASNLVTVADAGGAIRPIKHSPIERVDGMIALLMALQRALFHEIAPRSVYTERGLRVI